MPEDQFQELVALFGGVAAVASGLGVGETAVYNWRQRGLSKGTKWSLFELARQRGIELPSWFYSPGSIEAA